MAVGSWEVPFWIKSAVYSVTPLDLNAPFNFPAGQGIIFLNPQKCKMRNTVRLTKYDIPQQDGSILTRFRYVKGMELDLGFWLMEDEDHIACDDLLQSMLDTLHGYLYNLLNAGDNEGRVFWTPDGDSSPASVGRMLDDVRLSGYPDDSQQPGSPMEVTCTVDTAVPYEQDLTPSTPSIPGSVTVYGNRPVYPVWRLYGTFTTVEIEDTATGATWKYDGSLPGAPDINSPNYIEVNTLNNTVFVNGDQADALAGMVMSTSTFFSLNPGVHTIAVTYTGGSGGASYVEFNSAWA